MPRAEGGCCAAILESLPDAELVARCRARDDEAWAALVSRFSRYVYAITSQGFRLSDADAEDVFQEVFARTYQHLDRLRDDAAIRPWIAQLTRRLAIDQLRAAARVQPEEAPEELAAPDEEAFARIDEAMTVREALKVLPDNCFDVVDRFFCRDESYRAIGAALDLPSGTIASRISRCLEKLRAELEEKGGAEGRNGVPSASGRG